MEDINEGIFSKGKGKILPIMKYYDSEKEKQILRNNSEDITKDYPELETLIDDMKATLNSRGIGLAAPQIGKNINLFLTKNIFSPIEVFINPKIISTSVSESSMEEGCLSLPSEFEVSVKRPTSVIMEYYDENFIKKKIKFSGFISKVVQHEFDHLRGILIIDK